MSVPCRPRCRPQNRAVIARTLELTLAVAAIVISALTFLWTVGWSVYTYRRATRPSLTVQATWGAAVLGGQVSNMAFNITATNTGQAAVALTSAKLLIREAPKGTSVAPIDWIVQTPASLPIRLEPGGHWNGLLDAASVKATLDRHQGHRGRWHVCPVLSDSAGRTYRADVSGRRLLPSRWMELT
jgi:hypothetical protein